MPPSSQCPRLALRLALQQLDRSLLQQAAGPAVSVRSSRSASAAAAAWRLDATPAASARRAFATAPLPTPPPPPPPPPPPAGARGAALAARAREGASSPFAAYLAALVVGMVGATYASVPLYRLFCQATGFGGTTQRATSVEEKFAAQALATSSDAAALAAREITVTFNADVSDSLPWRFRPSQRQVVVRPGESALAFYTATNTSSQPVTGVSTYNVTPMRAGLYFNKVQCFCFEEQRLLPGETLDMPVFFYIDPEYVKDDKLKNTNLLTLSYTFFKAESAEEEEAPAAPAPAPAPSPAEAPPPPAAVAAPPPPPAAASAPPLAAVAAQ